MLQTDMHATGHHKFFAGWVHLPMPNQQR